MRIERFRSSVPLGIVAGVVLVWTTSVSPQPLPTTRPAARVPTSQPADSVPYPHWSPDGCRHCHDLRNGQVQPIVPEAIDTVCLTCHDGRRAKSERHPIGRTFKSEQVEAPEGWPLLDGKLSCVTCHDIRQACDRERPRSDSDPAFVRDWPLIDVLAFCARCHIRPETHTRHNLHHMLTATGEIADRACRLCHKSLPDPADHMQRTGRPDLQTDEFRLCLGCHRRHVDFFEPGHIGARVSTRMQAAINDRLPLSEDGSILCSTCHNPHQAGLFPPGSELAGGEIRYDKERLQLRGFGKELCFVCHDR